MEKSNLEKIFDFLNVVGDLKNQVRYGDFDIDPDSTADHTWRLALMVFMIADEIKLNLDVLKAVKIALVHDMPEAITGDIPYMDVAHGHITKADKQKNEIRAMEEMMKILPEEIGKEIFGLWEEYEYGKTKEALFVKALDKFESTSYVIEKGRNYSDPEVIATYADRHVKNFPELKEISKIIKKRVKQEFQKRNIEWKPEYDSEDLK